jgi:hypothetical protein
MGGCDRGEGRRSGRGELGEREDARYGLVNGVKACGDWSVRRAALTRG